MQRAKTGFFFLIEKEPGWRDIDRHRPMFMYWIAPLIPIRTHLISVDEDSSAQLLAGAPKLTGSRYKVSHPFDFECIYLAPPLAFAT